MVTYVGRVDKPNPQNSEINLQGNPNGAPVTIEVVGDPVIEKNDSNTEFLFTGTINGVSYTNFLITSYDVEFSAALPSVAAGSNNGDLNKVPDQLEGEPILMLLFPQILNGGDPLRIMILPGVKSTDPNSSLIQNIATSAISVVSPNFNPPPTCFLAGTILQTAHGARQVETLEIGDEIMTAEGRLAKVVWVSSSLHEWSVDADGSDKPIVFRAAACDELTPSEDLIVSPQHHVLIAGPVVSKLFGADEVLAPAKGLTALPGVRVMEGKRAAEYYHVMLDHHEVIMAHGVPTESFYPGPTAIRMLTPAQRASLYAVVPALKDDPENGYGPTARKKITRREAETLVNAILADRKAKAIAAE